MRAVVELVQGAAVLRSAVTPARIVQVVTGLAQVIQVAPGERWMLQMLAALLLQAPAGTHLPLQVQMQAQVLCHPQHE